MQDMQGVSLAVGEAQRIEKALDAIAENDHAPREMTVKLTLHVHKEYPKDVDGTIVNSAAEEAEVRANQALGVNEAKASAAAAEAQAPAAVAEMPAAPAAVADISAGLAGSNQASSDEHEQ